MEVVPVRQLIETGYMFIPVNPVLVDTAKAAWSWVIEEEKDSVSGFPITRRGEPEPDLGHIVRPGHNGGDKKHFLHLAHDFCFHMTLRQRKFFKQYEQEFVILEDLRKHLNQVAFEVVAALDASCKEIFTEPLLPLVRRSTKLSKPYATTTLRSLWYPPGPDQTGACIHIDRSLLTIHVGDSGGQLLGYQEEEGEPFSVTPPAGYAAVFFGVKALYLSEGRIEPLWHSSTVEPGRPRTAMVQFVQADIGIEVSDSRLAYNDFYENCER